MMKSSKNPPLISGTQFVAIVVLTMAVFLIVDFGRRATAGYYVSQAEKQLQTEIAAELELQGQLKARRDYVMSDEYVEKWAREHAHMVRPGDQPLILVTPRAPQSIPVSRPEGNPAPVTPAPAWHQWWHLFLDTKPGTLGI
jgi:cell division protein FtsB